MTTSKASFRHVPGGIALLACVALAAFVGSWLTSPARASQVPFVSPDLIAQPITTLGITITDPGLYRVAHDLTGLPGQDGIRVAANHVTIDLGGFTLDGGGSPGEGVVLLDGFSHLTVANGRVTNWATGIEIHSFGNVRNVVADANIVGFALSLTYIEACEARDNDATGVTLGFGCIARACSSAGNGAHAFSLFNATIEDSSATASGPFSSYFMNRSTATRCRAGGGGSIGFNARDSTVVDCTADSVGQGFELSEASVARDCTADDASVAAFVASQSRLESCNVRGDSRLGISLLAYSIAKDCIVVQEGALGIEVGEGSVADGCVVRRLVGTPGGDAIQAHRAATVRGCRVDSPLDNGIVVLNDSATVVENVVDGAFKSGIIAGSNGLVARNVVSNCGEAAIATEGDANRFEQNTVRASAFGFRIVGKDNLLIRNDGADNAVEHSIAPGNTRGPLLTDQDWIQGTNPYYNFDLTF